MTTRDPLVVFTPSGKRGHFPVGTPLLQAARSLGVDIDSVCGGRGLCGRCQVVVAEGEFAKHGVFSSSASLSPFSEPERRFSRRVPLAQGRRLSCSARVEADVVIDVPASSQVHRQVVRKENVAQSKRLTIMGDKDIPYRLLRKIMFTSARANFSDVSFAVRQRFET